MKLLMQRQCAFIANCWLARSVLLCDFCSNTSTDAVELLFMPSNFGRSILHPFDSSRSSPENDSIGNIPGINPPTLLFNLAGDYLLDFFESTGKNRNSEQASQYIKLHRNFIRAQSCKIVFYFLSMKKKIDCSCYSNSFRCPQFIRLCCFQYVLKLLLVFMSNLVFCCHSMSF